MCVCVCVKVQEPVLEFSRVVVVGGDRGDGINKSRWKVPSLRYESQGIAQISNLDVVIG